MREIEFRGIARFNGTIGSDKMIHGNNIRYQKSGDTFDVYINGTRCILDTVGQYTGLKDKNGIKIFEGDVISLGNGIKKLITFINGGFGYTGFCDEPIGFAGHVNFAIIMEHIEVIGNVHETPELLHDLD